MIIVRLKGGFANQLFQYATARKLAEQNNSDLFFDLSYLNRNSNGAYTQRKFELEQIKLKGKLISDKDLFPFKIDSFLKRVLNKLRIGKYLTINETASTSPTELLELKGNYLLDGYWQNEHYFNSIRGELLQEVQPSYSFTKSGEELKKLITESNSVSVHVRRGDYVSLKSAHAFHGTCTIDYYKHAIKYLTERSSRLTFFVFSDDIEWCKKEMGFIQDVVFVENESDKMSSQDLFMMSLCKHNIIANSSYSWWSAWLNQNQEKTIIAPKRWFNDSAIDTSGLIPKSWIKI